MTPGPVSFIPNGCSAHPDCFTCPFDDCIAVSNLHSTEPDVNQAKLKQYRKKYSALERLYRFEARCLTAAKMARDGEKIVHIARALEISVTTAGTYISHGLDIQNRPLKKHQATGTTPEPPAVRLRGRLLYERG